MVEHPSAQPHLAPSTLWHSISTDSERIAPLPETPKPPSVTQHPLAL